MKKGDHVVTPRFLAVEICEVYDTQEKAYAAGYTEPTHYHEGGYTVLGKSLDVYDMEFAACREEMR